MLHEVASAAQSSVQPPPAQSSMTQDESVEHCMLQWPSGHCSRVQLLPPVHSTWHPIPQVPTLHWAPSRQVWEQPLSQIVRAQVLWDSQVCIAPPSSDARVQLALSLQSWCPPPPDTRWQRDPEQFSPQPPCSQLVVQVAPPLHSFSHPPKQRRLQLALSQLEPHPPAGQSRVHSEPVWQEPEQGV